MRAPPALRARDADSAAHTLAVLLAACALVCGLYALLGPDSFTHAVRPVVWPSTAGTALVALIFATVPPDRLDRAGAFVAVGVAGVASLCVLSLLIGRNSIGTQSFLALAVLYAGFHLRPAGVVVVTGTSLVVDAVMLLQLEPMETAVTDLLFSGVTLAVMGTLLVRSGLAQERLVAELESQAALDGLTGLLTRRVFDQALRTALVDAPGPDGSALLLMDVDAFKTINDEHGHPVGDSALVHLAEVIKGCVRASDAVVSRLGGDELAILLPGCAPEVATRRAEQVLDAVRGTPLTLPDGTLLALSVSIGVAHAPIHARDLRAVYAAADAALYEAKRTGRDRVAVAVAGWVEAQPSA